MVALWEEPAVTPGNSSEIHADDALPARWKPGAEGDVPFQRDGSVAGAGKSRQFPHDAVGPVRADQDPAAGDAGARFHGYPSATLFDSRNRVTVVERNAGDLRPLYQKGIEMPPLCEIRDRLRVTTGEATLEVMADEYSVDGALDDRREIERQ